MRLVALTGLLLVLTGCADWNWRESGRALLKQLCFAESSVSCDEERAAQRRY
ncbi:MAG: hypothetical protein RLW87_03015 [Alphaproteobacteria bacterium]|jgi:hypothetical protein|uniref:hypothetical protein n=1 Tax=Pacificispira sp. TaxID=2888761 RepID=UPI001B0A8BAF|nr:hypothetical protein [Alphaproteobacteria bacterium]MBO6864629.1 hypothetical protein [Alphaproteobacteria bacterium]MEC9266138.1 hypothetical protein [Pseudomonadota bacterium]